MSAFQYAVSDCDVQDKEALRAFRQVRTRWSEWLDDDEQHAIWRVISGLIWRDVSFATISEVARRNPKSPLNSVLLGEMIVQGHVAQQVLALRRLTDPRRDAISLRRLIKDVRRNWHLITRENFVCFNGLPYDHLAAEREYWLDKPRNVAIWVETSGPEAYGTSELYHAQFDRLCGTMPASRSRDDILPRSLLATCEAWLDSSDAEDIATWSHKYLAHAGDSRDRAAIAHIQLTNHKISQAIVQVCRVAEAISGHILYIGGRANALMPIPQFDVLDRFEARLTSADAKREAEAVWERKTSEWDGALEDVATALFDRTTQYHGRHRKKVVED